MRIPGIHLIHKLCALLAVLLCSALTLCIPGKALAAPAAEKIIGQYAENTDGPAFQIIAREISAGESEAVIQLNKSLLLPLFQAVLSQLYPAQHTSNIKPDDFPFSQGDCGKHSSLSKGP